MQVQVQEIDQISRKRGVEIPSFIPEIDGLRGIAIIAVLFFHLGQKMFSLGWAGVELFFVLSGFLITRILLNARDKEGYFKKFYIRRTLRIFPIYYLVLLLCTIALLFASSSELRVLPFYYLYIQTIPQIATEFRVVPLLSHTWTLAIEEQFYLVWPAVVFLLRGKKLLVAIGVLMATALCLRFISLGFSNPFLIDGWIGVQVDALAAGALVAYAASHVSSRKVLQRWLSVAFVLGTLSLIAIVVLLGPAAFWTPKIWGRSWAGPLLISAMTSCFAGLVGLTAIGHPWTSWLKFQPLRRWGKISYGIYLYHPFVLLFVSQLTARLYHGHNHLISISFTLAKLGVTYLVAWISWQVIEKPILQLKDRLAP